MPRTERPVAEPETRAHLLAEAKSFTTLMVSTLLEDDRESGQYAFDQLSPRVRALEAGQAVSFHRYELPAGHRLSAPGAGHPCDTLELGEDNVVRDLTAERVFWGRCG